MQNDGKRLTTCGMDSRSIAFSICSAARERKQAVRNARKVRTRVNIMDSVRVSRILCHPTSK